MSLKARLLKNVGASTFSKVSGALASIASVPIFLALLGVEKYSAWLVISAVPVWLAMADVGFGSVAANEMSIRVSRSDWTGAEKVFQSAWAAILALSLVGAIAVALAGFFLPWAKWLGVNAISGNELKWSIVALGFSSIIALQGSLASGLFRAKGRANVAIGLMGIKPLVDTAFVALGLLLFHSILAASVALLLSQLAYIGLSLHWGLKVCPEIRLGVSKCNREDLSYCFWKGIAFCIFPLGNAFVIQGSTLIVNAVLGPAAVVVFNTCRTMIRSAQQVLNLLGQSVWPEFSHLVGSGDLRRARQLHYVTLASNVAVATVAGTLIIAAGPFVYGIWTGHQLRIDRVLIGSFVPGIICNALWFGASTVVSASNRHERFAIVYLAGSVLTVPACYFFSKYCGLAGAALSSLVLDLTIAPVLFFQTMLITDDRPEQLLKGTWKVFADATLRMGQFCGARLR